MKWKIVKFKNGQIGLRRFSIYDLIFEFTPYEYMDLHDYEFTWNIKDEFFEKECKGNLEQVWSAIVYIYRYEQGLKDFGTPI